MPQLFIVSFLIFGSIVTGVFYLRPSWQEFLNIRKETEDLRNISIELDELTENRDDLIKIVNSVSKDDLRRIDQALPQGQKSAELLVLLENLSREHGITLSQVELATAVEESKAGGQPKPGGVVPVSIKTVKEFPVTLGVSGSYQSLKGFLTDLEKNLRLIDVQSLSFTSPNKETGFKFNIRGKTYYQ